MSDGVRFRRAGDIQGEPAVFLPAADWTGTEGLAVAAACPQFSWHLLDLPGTGGSRPLARADAQGLALWLAGFCGRMGMAAPHLAGHSLGGYLALAVAATGSLPIRSLLLIDGGVGRIAVPQEMGWLAYAVPFADACDRLLGGRLIARKPGAAAPADEIEEPAAIARRLRVPLSDLLVQAHADLAAPREAPWNLDRRAAQRLGLIGVRTWGPRSLRRVKAPLRALVAMFPSGPPWAATRARRSLQALHAAGVDAVAVPTGHYVFWDDPSAFAAAATPFYARATPGAPA